MQYLKALCWNFKFLNINVHQHFTVILICIQYIPNCYIAISKGKITFYLSQLYNMHYILSKLYCFFLKNGIPFLQNLSVVTGSAQDNILTYIYFYWQWMPCQVASVCQLSFLEVVNLAPFCFANVYHFFIQGKNNLLAFYAIF